MKPEVVFFDCDGVISDNEKEEHQVAFNQAFTVKIKTLKMPIGYRATWVRLL